MVSSPTRAAAAARSIAVLLPVRRQQQKRHLRIVGVVERHESRSYGGVRQQGGRPQDAQRLCRSTLSSLVSVHNRLLRQLMRVLRSRGAARALGNAQASRRRSSRRVGAAAVRVTTTAVGPGERTAYSVATVHHSACRAAVKTNAIAAPVAIAEVVDAPEDGSIYRRTHPFHHLRWIQLEPTTAINGADARQRKRNAEAAEE
jgi:hypothetical protein